MLDRKLDMQLERDYVKMIWDVCVSHKFSKFIYARDNFIELCQPHTTYQNLQDLQNISLLKTSLRQHLKTIQYVYSLLFPEIYNRTNKFGISNKSHFDFIFNNWKHNKNFANIQLPKRIGKQQHAQQQNKMKLEKRLKVPKKRFHIHLNKNHKKSK